MKKNKDPKWVPEIDIKELIEIQKEITNNMRPYSHIEGVIVIRGRMTEIDIKEAKERFGENIEFMHQVDYLFRYAKSEHEPAVLLTHLKRWFPTEVYEKYKLILEKY